MNLIDNENYDDCSGHDKLLVYEKNIKDLEVELDELKFISNNTKEYLFVLEKEITAKNKEIKSLKKDKKKKNKKIKSLKKDIKKKNKRIKFLKNENQLLKSSTSWKITSPLRKFFNLFKK